MVMSSLPKRIRKLLPPTASSSAFSTFFLNWKLVLSPAFKSWLLVFTSALYRTRRWFQCSYFGLFPVSSKQFHNHINPIHSFTEVCHLGMFLWPSFLLIPSFSELHFFFFLIHRSLWHLTSQTCAVLSLALILGTSVSKNWFIWRLALYNVLTWLILILSSFWKPSALSIYFLSPFNYTEITF